MRSSTVSTLFLLATAWTSQAVGPLEKRDGSKIHWSYYGEQGPLRWHSLDASFKACGTGKYQSPINLTPTSAPIINSTSGALYLDYARTGDFTCENTGLTIQCLPKDGEAEKFKLKAKGVEYKLANFHLHTPSEHQIGGVYHPLEVHFVHASGEAGDPNTKNAVVGVFLDFDSSSVDDFVSRLMPPTGNSVRFQTTGLQSLSEAGGELKMDNLPLGNIKRHVDRSPIFHYEGSLTTPPCTEGIQWYLARHTMAVRFKEYEILKGVLKFNSRITQNDPGHDNLLSSPSSGQSGARRVRRRL